VKEFIDLVCNLNMMQQMMMEIGQCFLFIYLPGWFANLKEILHIAFKE